MKKSNQDPRKGRKLYQWRRIVINQPTSGPPCQGPLLQRSCPVAGPLIETDLALWGPLRETNLALWWASERQKADTYSFCMGTISDSSGFIVKSFILLGSEQHFTWGKEGESHSPDNVLFKDSHGPGDVWGVLCNKVFCVESFISVPLLHRMLTCGC